MKLHKCEKHPPYSGSGPYIKICREFEDGTLWVETGESSTQVNFCPFCGREAKILIKQNII